MQPPIVYPPPPPCKPILCALRPAAKKATPPAGRRLTAETGYARMDNSHARRVLSEIRTGYGRKLEMLVWERNNVFMTSDAPESFSPQPNVEVDPQLVFHLDRPSGHGDRCDSELALPDRATSQVTLTVFAQSRGYKSRLPMQ